MDYLGIKKSAFTDWKAGKSRSYLKYASEIADYFGITTDYLLRGETDTKEKPATSQDDELDKEFSELIKQLSPEQREIIKAQIKGILSNY